MPVVGKKSCSGENCSKMVHFLTKSCDNLMENISQCIYLHIKFYIIKLQPMGQIWKTNPLYLGKIQMYFNP